MIAQMCFELPLPQKVGTGRYQGWLELCKTTAQIGRPSDFRNSIVGLAGDIVERTLDLEVPKGYPDGWLLLPWCERLLQDIEALPDGFQFDTRTVSGQRPFDGNTLRITIHVDLGHASTSRVG